MVVEETNRLEREQIFHDNEVGKKDVRKNQGKYYADLNLLSKYLDKEIGDLKGKIVLDYGCGQGLAALKYLQAGAIVYAIDISPVLVEKLKTKAQRMNLHKNLYASVMNAEELVFEDNFFDIVVGNAILHHLNVKKACKEVFRVLKPRGKAIFLEPLGTNPFINLYRKFTMNSRTIDEKPFTKKEISWIKTNFNDSNFAYFEFFTLISSLFLALRMKKFSRFIRYYLEKMDWLVLHKIKIFKRLSWITVITIRK